MNNNTNLFDACCELCWHSVSKPCSQLIPCLLEGPLCHESNECGKKRAEAVKYSKEPDTKEPVFYIGAGTCGLGAGAGKTKEVIVAYCKEKSINPEFIETGCIGLCSAEPIIDIKLPGKARVSFSNVTKEKVEDLLNTVIAEDKIPTDDILGQYSNDGDEWGNVPFINDHPFFAPQKRLVLENCGIINPENIEAYIVTGGYRAMADVISQKTPEEVCAYIAESGLRGRGGGGFPTGKKWQLALNTPSDQKYFVCNADEGDPGAFMDRAVIEGDPHRLIEGLAIASYAIGATKAYVYIRAEYPLAIERLKIAIAQAREVGLLGYNILDSGFNLDIIIKKGAGAFVCGEETALLHSIEGKRGMPRIRPPYPSESGLFEHPTVINNVETLSNVPGILLKGKDAYKSLGSENSPGTKVFALSGKVVRTGLIEIEIGKTVKDIVFTIGGGIPDNKKYKAVQIGGPSGGCIPLEKVDIKVDYESLKTIGAMMGSGGLVVMDEDNCMVDVAKFFMEFIQRESCGKCIPCREGTRRMLEILQSITRGRSNEKGNDALERFKGVVQLEKLAEVIKDTSLCGLGQSAPNPVLTTLHWFKDEYDAHIYERKCPAGACTELTSYSIIEDACRGCTLCAKKCPTDAIKGAVKSPHYIIENKCIGCGTCYDVCKFNAVTKA